MSLLSSTWRMKMEEPLHTVLSWTRLSRARGNPGLLRPAELAWIPAFAGMM